MTYSSLGIYTCSSRHDGCGCVILVLLYFQTTPASLRPVPEPPLITSQGARLKETGTKAQWNHLRLQVFAVLLPRRSTSHIVLSPALHFPSVLRSQFCLQPTAFLLCFSLRTLINHISGAAGSCFQQCSDKPTVLDAQHKTVAQKSKSSIGRCK